MIATNPSQVAPEAFTLPGTTWEAMIYPDDGTWGYRRVSKSRDHIRKGLEKIASGKKPPQSRGRQFVKGASLGSSTFAWGQRQAYIKNVGHEPRTIERWGEVL